jgi:hypothetical protein
MDEFQREYDCFKSDLRGTLATYDMTLQRLNVHSEEVDKLTLQVGRSFAIRDDRFNDLQKRYEAFQDITTKKWE